MNTYEMPRIVTERIHGKNEIRGAHMCSNCHVKRINPVEVVNSAGKPEGEWKVKVLDDHTITLTAPIGVTFIEDTCTPIEEIVLAIMETIVLQKRESRCQSPE
jgi:hypothetical protein